MKGSEARGPVEVGFGVVVEVGVVVEEGGAREVQGGESAVVVDCFFELREGDRVADEGEVEVGEVEAFGERGEAVGAAACQYPGAVAGDRGIEPHTQTTPSAQQTPPGSL